MSSRSLASLPSSSGPANTLWVNVKLAARADPNDVIDQGALAIADGKVAWLGHLDQLPEQWRNVPRCDGGGRLLTPGLVDCHTHLVYAGQRADEYAMRLAGASYEAVAQQGGGIISTVRATRAATEETLFKQSARRLEALIASGATAVEIKSGYGLDLITERKILRVARQLAQHYPVTISTTFLGAHSLPPEYKGQADAYLSYVCHTVLPKLHDEGLVDAVDIFCEHLAFSAAHSDRLFNTAARLGLPVKMHAEQLSNIGGSAVAARHKALSSDHLEYLDEAGVSALAASGTVAVLLPGAFYFIREKRVPPIALLRQYGVPMAVSTDCNPGTSPMTSLTLAMNMACTLFGLTAAEALSGVTRHAAQAFGHPGVTGTLDVGGWADFALWSVDSISELAYWIGHNTCDAVYRRGHPVTQTP